MSRLPLEVHVFVRRGDRYLVLHRVPRDGAYWHSVAGALEEGESFAAAAARELREETGLVAQPREIAPPYRYLDVEVHVFLAEAPHEWEPELNEEHDDYRWLPQAEASELLHWPEPKAIILTL